MPRNVSGLWEWSEDELWTIVRSIRAHKAEVHGGDSRHSLVWDRPLRYEQVDLTVGRADDGNWCVYVDSSGCKIEIATTFTERGETVESEIDSAVQHVLAWRRMLSFYR